MLAAVAVRVLKNVHLPLLVLAIGSTAHAAEVAPAPAAPTPSSAAISSEVSTAAFCARQPERCTDNRANVPAEAAAWCRENAELCRGDGADAAALRERQLFCEQNPERCAVEAEEIKAMRDDRRQVYCAEHPEACAAVGGAMPEMSPSCRENPNDCRPGQPGYKGAAQGPEREAFCAQQPEVCRKQQDELDEVRD